MTSSLVCASHSPLLYCYAEQPKDWDALQLAYEERIKAVKKYNKRLKVLGVTVLTSFSNSAIKKVGHTRSIKDLVKRQAVLARAAKLDGIVCSAHEIKVIKKICKNMEIITPGIRLKGEKSKDQKRVMSPREAFDNGATSIVMGRSIIKGNIKHNVQKLIKSLK